MCDYSVLTPCGTVSANKFDCNFKNDIWLIGRSVRKVLGVFPRTMAIISSSRAFQMGQSFSVVSSRWYVPPIFVWLFDIRLLYNTITQTRYNIIFSTHGLVHQLDQLQRWPQVSTKKNRKRSLSCAICLRRKTDETTATRKRSHKPFQGKSRVQSFLI